LFQIIRDLWKVQITAYAFTVEIATMVRLLFICNYEVEFHVLGCEKRRDLRKKLVLNIFGNGQLPSLRQLFFQHLLLLPPEQQVNRKLLFINNIIGHVIEHSIRRQISEKQDLSHFLSGEEVKALPIPDVEKHMQIQPDNIQGEFIVNQRSRVSFVTPKLDVPSIQSLLALRIISYTNCPHLGWIVRYDPIMSSSSFVFVVCVATISLSCEMSVPKKDAATRNKKTQKT
jgi:hypothetical protein